MARPGISRELFDSIIRSTKVNVVDRRSWTRLESADKHFRIYVQKSKTVRQVDLTNFPAGIAGTVPPEKKNGKVTSHLDLNDEKMALKVFTTLCNQLKTMKKPVEQKEETKATPKKETKEVKKTETKKAA